MIAKYDLNILCCQDLEECVLITDTSISQLSAHCPGLESLSLSHCELITDEAIRCLTSDYLHHYSLYSHLLYLYNSQIYL